jgi:hypothetical protein
MQDYAGYVRRIEVCDGDQPSRNDDLELEAGQPEKKDYF